MLKLLLAFLLASWRHFWWFHGYRLPFRICLPAADGVGGFGVWLHLPTFISGGWWVYLGLTRHPNEVPWRKSIATHFTLQSRRTGQVALIW